MSYYVLDYIPGDQPKAQVISDDFKLANFSPTNDIKIGDLLDDEAVDNTEEISFDKLSQGAKTELEYGIKEIIEKNEQEFISFFNDAGAISIRMHQLDLLPGIGEKTRNSILEEREVENFDSFKELEERVKEIHNPKEIVVERILDELKNNDIKYRLFVR